MARVFRISESQARLMESVMRGENGKPRVSISASNLEKTVGHDVDPKNPESVERAKKEAEASTNAEFDVTYDN